MNLVWNVALPWPLIVGLGIVAGFILFLSYQKPRRSIPALTRRGLFALRALVLLVLLFFLARPGLEGKEGVSEENRLLILVDSSRSMTVQDEGGRSRHDALRDAWSRSQTPLKELATAYRVSTYRFGSELREFRDLSFDPTDERTWIGSALADAVSRAENGTLEHMVLISDGQNNGGKDPQGVARAIAGKGTRIHTVWLGKPAGSTSATRVSARAARGPEEVMTGRIFEVSADFLAVGAAGQELVVDFAVDGGLVSTGRTPIRDSQQSLTLAFSHQFAEEGSHLLSFTARPLRGESIAGDQTCYLPVKVRKKLLEVLYVEGQIRDEFKYVRRSLARFSDLKLSTILTVTPEPGQELLPRDVASWLKYDVVLFGDVPAVTMTEAQRAALEEAVRKGLGFVMIGGFENFGAGGYAGTPVADLLPVRVESREQKTEESYTLVPTDEGIRSTVLRLSPDPAKNLALWRSLPTLKGYAVASPKKRGESVLATGPSGEALLVAQDYGSGRSMAFLADTTWRWWRSAGGREDLHKRFWRQMVLWLGHREGRGEGQVRLRTEKPVYEPGDGVRIRVEVHDGAREPVEGALLRATLSGPDGKKQPIRLDPEPGGYGETFLPTLPGKYRIEAAAERDRISLGQDATDFVVQVQERELRTPYANPELLQHLADVTKGRSVDVAGLPELLKKLRAEHRPLRLERAVSLDVWNSWWVLGLFWLFLAGEWLIRRWQGFF
ncbi:MAG TPA: glutamine amidotransferase [Planctomycetota bacterium]|jgi:uncharacterized membrane protein|nr:glutamine amidotransferase [Planctomycetota bacterium]